MADRQPRSLASACLGPRREYGAAGDRFTFQEALDVLLAELQRRPDWGAHRWRVTIGPGRYLTGHTFLHAHRVPTEPPC